MNKRVSESSRTVAVYIFAQAMPTGGAIWAYSLPEFGRVVTGVSVNGLVEAEKTACEQALKGIRLGSDVIVHTSRAVVRNRIVSMLSCEETGGRVQLVCVHVVGFDAVSRLAEECARQNVQNSAMPLMGAGPVLNASANHQESREVRPA